MISERQAPDGPMLPKICLECKEQKPPEEYYPKRKYCKACCTVRSRRRAQENPEKSAQQYRKFWLKRYNLTPADYENLLAAQGGVCAICKGSYPGPGGSFRIDHDHACCPERMKSCGKCIRGLLCNYCNLHLAGEDPQRLRNAADYIEKARANMHSGLPEDTATKMGLHPKPGGPEECRYRKEREPRERRAKRYYT